MPRAARSLHAVKRTPRGAISVAPVRRIRGSSNITELFDLGGRFDRNEITREEIDKLRNMIDSDGVHKVASDVGVHAQTLYAVCAGFGHRLARKTAAKVRDFVRD